MTTSRLQHAGIVQLYERIAGKVLVREANECEITLVDAAGAHNLDMQQIVVRRLESRVRFPTHDRLDFAPGVSGLAFEEEGPSGDPSIRNGWCRVSKFK